MRASVAALTTVWVLASYASPQSDCPENEKTPIGTANQGGYRFNYQSGKGDECRTYRLRNTPGKVQTPALWKDIQEIFLDVDLPECAAGSNCPWTEAVKVSASPIIKDVTVLSYGVNKDEYRDEPDAYRKKPAQKGKLRPFITIIRGTVADPQKKPHALALQVSSYAEGGGEGRGYTLVYSIKLLEPSEPLLLLRPGVFPETSGLGLLWEAAASETFFKQIDERKIRQLSRGFSEFGIDIRARNISVEESKLLSFYKGDKRIAATTAPAYVPKD